jgi:hypothetical protein
LVACEEQIWLASLDNDNHFQPAGRPNHPTLCKPARLLKPHYLNKGFAAITKFVGFNWLRL